MVLSERNLYGHPHLLDFSENDKCKSTYRSKNGEEVSGWESLYVHTKKQFVLVHLCRRDLKMAGKKEHWATMLKHLTRTIDLEQPTPLLDQVIWATLNDKQKLIVTVFTSKGKPEAITSRETNAGPIALGGRHAKSLRKVR